MSAVAKRARQLLSKPDKPSDDVALSIAVDEMDNEQLAIKRTGRNDNSLLLD